MTDFTKPIIDLKPNSCLEFRINSKDQLESKFRNLTISGVPYAGEIALEYLEFKSNQKITPIEFIKQGQTIPIHTGQFLTTLDNLMGVFNWSEKKVRYWLNKWAKKGILILKTMKNEFGYKIGTLITANRLIEFRKQFQTQYQNHKDNQKNLNEKWGGRFVRLNQEKTENGADKIIKENTNKNNIENSLTFEANKKLFEFNAKILEDKRKQEKELSILKISLKKEKTKNNLLKSISRFKVKGSLKADKVKINWNFQKTPEYREIFEKLSSFGFDQYTINRLWWKYSNNIQKLIDYIDYTQMKYEQGKVKDKKKFLYHAIQANYDIGELEKMRWEAKSREEKEAIELERKQIEMEKRDEEDRLKAIQQDKNEKEYLEVKNWIQNNQSHTIFENFIEEIQTENKFFFGTLCRKAREKGIINVVDYLKSDKTSKMDLCVSGLYKKILDLSIR